MCHAFANAVDIVSAEQSISYLRTNYSNTRYAKQVLMLQQVLAMSKRDTLGVDNAIALMIKEGLPQSDLDIAYSMKGSFLRIKPRALIFNSMNTPKRINFSDDLRFSSNSQTIFIRNYPNPFNPSTVIEYYLPSETHVTLKVYNILGQEVACLVDKDEVAGKHYQTFESKIKSVSLPSGVYFYILTTTESQVPGKMNVVK